MAVGIMWINAVARMTPVPNCFPNVKVLSESRRTRTLEAMTGMNTPMVLAARMMKIPAICRLVLYPSLFPISDAHSAGKDSRDSSSLF